MVAGCVLWRGLAVSEKGISTSGLFAEVPLAAV